MEDISYVEEQKVLKINYKKALKILYSFSKSYKNNFLKALIFFIITTALRLTGPLFVKQIIDVAIKNRDFKYLVEIISLYFLVNFSYFLLNYYSVSLLIKNGHRLIYDLKNKLYAHILKLDVDYFNHNNPGKLAARIQSDTASIYEIFTEISISVFIDIIVFFVVFIIMAYHNIELTLVLLPVVIFIVILIIFFVKKSQKVFIEVRRKIAELTSFISEVLNLSSIIKVFNAENKIKEKFENVNFEKFIKTISAEYIAILFFLSIMLFDPLSKGIIFGYGGVKVINSYMSIGSIVMFMLYVGHLFEPLFRFSESVSVLQKSFAAVERINQIFSLKPQVIEGKKIIYSFNREIKFQNVWMKYSSSDWILKGVSFTIPKGKTVAIVGRTGEGKTTLANLLFRFYEYQEGKITIDDIDIKDINLNSLRQKIGLVEQTTYLFPGTIKDNLTLMNKNIDENKMNYAIKILGLEDFYKKYTLNYKIKEKGSNLSSGEKQIISLTRALVLDQEIIILDEATSNVDPYTEKLITGAIKNVMKYKTMIIIAHRLSTIKNSDYIAFLKDGKIVEFGNHGELMKLKGNYYTYYTLQL